MVARLPDWEARLADYLAWSLQRPHEYGEHDCMLFPAGAVHAQTGEDWAADHRGQYHDAETAMRYLRTLGFRRTHTFVNSLLPEKSLVRAGRGDIVMDADGIPGVCIGGEALMVGEAGYVRVPRKQWRRAWHV